MATPRFAKVTEQMIRDRRLTLRDLRVLLALLVHCDANGRCWPKRESISDMTGLDPNRVTKVTTRLAELGWMEKSHPGGRGSTAGYQIHRSVTLADPATLNPVRVADSATLEDPVTLADSATLNDPVTLADSATLNPVRVADSATLNPVTLADSATLNESYPQALLFLRDKENTENTENKERSCVKKNVKPCAAQPEQPNRKRKGMTYSQHHAALFEQAWELAREINRAAPSRCDRKRSMSRWDAKCKKLDSAQACLDCWRMEVDSHRAGSGLAFQRGFQVYLNSDCWTHPDTLADLAQAAKGAQQHGDEHGKRNGNGNGARPRYESSVERYDRAHRAYFDRAIAEEEAEERERAARTFDAQPENH